MGSLDTFAAAKLAGLAALDRRRTLVETARADGLWVTRGGRRLLSFSCNDYLNLTQHRAVKAAAIAAIRRWGAGAGAARLVTGNHPLYAALEEKLARFKGAEAALVFGSGYLANAGILPTFAGAGDLVLIDALSHASLRAGAELSRAKVLVFRHNDMGHVEDLLATQRQNHPHTLIATEGVFSMDGDLAPLPALAALARRFDAWLLVDDAHGLGVLGGGRGSIVAQNLAAEVPLQMGTLSKAIGGYGGFLCATQAVIDLIATRARTFVYATGLPPATVAAATAALDIIAETPALTALPLAKARAFTDLAGLPPATSAIVPVVLGEDRAALEAARRLEAEGFLAVPIRPPTVPAGTARLRLAFTAGHPDAAVARLAGLVREQILPMRRTS